MRGGRRPASEARAFHGYTSYSHERTPMNAKIQRWGNSQGLRLSKAILAQADFEVGDEVIIVVQDGTIVVRPARSVRGKLDLRELVEAIPKDYAPEEVDWGEPLSREAW